MKKNLSRVFAVSLSAAVLAAAVPAGIVGAEEDKTITVAASPTPHAEILNEAAKILAQEGWDLQITEFEDWCK